jgi:serine protease AprX
MPFLASRRVARPVSAFLAVLALAVAGVVHAVPNPAGGELTEGTPELAYTGGPLPAADPEQLCLTAQVCEVYNLEVDLPADFDTRRSGDVVEVQLAAIPSGDGILALLDADGEVIQASDGGFANAAETITFNPVPGVTQYGVRVSLYAGSAASYSVTIKLKSPADPCAAGAAPAEATATTGVDAAVLAEWSKLPASARYGAFVHFRRSATLKQQEALLAAPGIDVTHDFRRYVRSVFVQAPVTVLRALAASPHVLRIEHNKPLRYLDATQSWTTRVRMVQERVATGPYKDASGDILAGKGVTLGIIDGGLFGAHPDFTGRVQHNYKLVDPVGGLPASYVDVGTGDSENGGGGHGTHVTGIVAGDGTMSDGGYPDATVAPWAPGTFTSASPQASIIHWGNGAAIAVLNVGGAYTHLLDNLDSFDPPLKAVNNSYGDGINPDTDEGYPYDAGDTDKQLVKQIVCRGVNMVYAAGNDGGDGSLDRVSSYCKDPTPGVICVASYNDQGTGALDAPLSSFSSRGKAGNPTQYPDIAAPGDLSTSTCAQATPTQAICTGGDDSAAETEWQPWYGTISGTSMASPNITGVIGAIAQANPALSPAAIEALLQRTARKVGGGYEPDPQNPGSTTHFGYGAGLVDIQAAVNAIIAGTPGLGITQEGLLPEATEWTVFKDDADVDVPEGAADALTLTMQNVSHDGLPGVMYRLTVADATALVSPALAYRVDQNVRGVPTTTTVLLTADGAAPAEPGATNTAPATMAVLEGNVIRFFVPYMNLGFPPINEPIHNIRVIVSNDGGALDYAPSPAASTIASAPFQPMFGRAFTTRLAPGTLPPSTERACELPGLTRVTSGAGTTGDSSSTGHDDLRRIWVAEPGDMPGKLVITMKVDNLAPAPVASYRWYVYFNTPARTDVEAQFVAMDTVAPGGSSAAPAFQRGFRSTIDNPAAPVGSFTIEGTLPDSSFNVDGTIRFVLDKAQFNLATGDAITGIAGSIRQTSNPSNGAGLTVDTGAALEAYVLVGNLPCPVTSNPIAELLADVTGGLAPLEVTFDASGSRVADGDDTIEEYTFDFGDGTPPVTQAGPVIKHTYTTVGAYTATVDVKDSDGFVSLVPGQQLIAVAGLPGTTARDLSNNRLGGVFAPAGLLVLLLAGLARRRRSRTAP